MANRVASDTMNTLLDGDYAPRRSNLVNHSGVASVVSDGDTWEERLAVCEGATEDGKPRLLIRSYYRNVRTKDRIWDEPPSGASRIRHATTEMRRAAHVQLQELQLTLEMIPPETEAAQSNSQESKKERKGFFGRFRKSKKEKKAVEVSKDLNLQRAIARSMTEQKKGSKSYDDDPVIYFDGEQQSTEEEDAELEMAKALSLSVSGMPSVMTEEEMMQRALEESRRAAATNEGKGVASMPNPLLDSNSLEPSTQELKPQFLDDDDFLDQKLPAK